MIQIIFGPAMAVMSRLRFALKLVLVGAMFLALVAGLSIFINGKLTTEIQTAETERLGIPMMAPARQLLLAVQTHRARGALALSGDQAAKEKLPEIASGVDEKLSSLNAVNKQFGASVGLADALEPLNKQWAEIKSNFSQLSPEDNFKKHGALIKDVLRYMTVVADKSGLTLDPDVEAFYLMDAAVFRLPSVIESVSRLRARGSGILKRQLITPDEKTLAVVLQNFFDKDFETYQENLDKALASSSALSVALGAKRQEAYDAGEHFLNNEVAALAKGDLTLAPQVYYDRATAAMTVMYDLYDASFQQLDNLLVARIHNLRMNLYLIYGAVGAVVLAVLYLFVGMLLSILRSLQSIQAGAERLAKGDVSQRVDSHSSDELGDVGDAVNSVTETLDKFTKAQLEMARAHNQDGRVSYAMRAQDFPGAYGAMARNLNEMVKSHVDVQMQFVDLMLEYTAFKFDHRMEKLPGERQKISDTAEKIRAELEAANKAKFNALIKAALDCVDNAVGVADQNANIVYLNPAFMAALRKNEAEIRRKIPGFDAEKAVGASAGALFDDPAAAVTRMRSLSRPHKLLQTLGRRMFQVVDSPIFDEKGERLGATGRWTDVTEQLSAEKEVAALVEAAVAGDFSHRIAESDKSGFMLQIAQGLNKVLGTNEQALAEVVRIMKALSDGDLSQTIDADFKGVFAQLKADSNETIERLRGIIQKIREFERIHQYGGARNRVGQQRLVAPHRGAGYKPGRNRKQR